MKAYKIVSVIDGKFYSYMASKKYLFYDQIRGMVVQYDLNKKTTYNKDTKGNKFLYCYDSLQTAIQHLPFNNSNFKLFECSITKSKSKTRHILSDSHVIPASSVTLTKDVTYQITGGDYL